MASPLTLPKGSYVASIRVSYGFLVRSSNIAPQEELHRT